MHAYGIFGIFLDFLILPDCTLGGEPVEVFKTVDVEVRWSLCAR